MRGIPPRERLSGQFEVRIQSSRPNGHQTFICARLCRRMCWGATRGRSQLCALSRLPGDCRLQSPGDVTVPSCAPVPTPRIHIRCVDSRQSVHYLTNPFGAATKFWGSGGNESARRSRNAAPRCLKCPRKDLREHSGGARSVAQCLASGSPGQRQRRVRLPNHAAGVSHAAESS